MARRETKLEESITKVVVAAVQRNGGNIVHAAKELGIDEQTVYRRLARAGLKRRWINQKVGQWESVWEVPAATGGAK